MNPIFERFNWKKDLDDMQVTPATNTKTGQNYANIKGVALTSDVVSLNARVYVDEELKRSARTLIGKSIFANHQEGIKIGHVTWAEYEDRALEYVGIVNKEPYVSLLKNKSTTIRGVSVAASFLANECPKCHKHFKSEEAFQDHMVHDELVKDVKAEPHGIVFESLSLVLFPETPGVSTATVELIETVNGEQRLLEMLVKEKGFALESSTAVGVVLSPVGPAKPKTKEYRVQPGLRVHEFHVEEDGHTLKTFTTRKDAENEVRRLQAEELGLKERIEQRDGKWCILHCHGDLAGQVIKCFDSEAEAQAMHQAMMANKESVARTEREKIEENLTFLGNHSDSKVKVALDYLLSVMDRRAEGLIQRAEAAEKKAGLKESVAERDGLRETVDSQKERILRLEEETAALKGEVSKRDPLVKENEELKIENDNIRDKVKGQFKGSHTTEKKGPEQHPVDPVTGRM
jgi:hypothetical protein